MILRETAESHTCAWRPGDKLPCPVPRCPHGTTGEVWVTWLYRDTHIYHRLQLVLRGGRALFAWDLGVIR